MKICNLLHTIQSLCLIFVALALQPAYYSKNDMKKQTSPGNTLQVIASGKNWIAVDKPAGMSVHNDPGKDLRAHLIARLQAEPDLAAVTGLTAASRLNAVHRLDRETSGVLLLAGDRSVLNHFAAQFEARTVDKRYVALLHGHLPANTDPDDWLSWKWSLTKSPGGRKNPRGKGPRKPCTTLVRAIDHSDHYTLVECKLLTGRKHQIRRHAKLAGHPVVGDRRYGSQRALDFLWKTHHFKRLGLHAARLEIVLPGNRPLKLCSQVLPVSIQRLFVGDNGTAADLP